MADCIDGSLFVRNKVSCEGSVSLSLYQVLKCCHKRAFNVIWGWGPHHHRMGSASCRCDTCAPGRDLGAVSGLSVPAVFLKLPNACCVLTLILPKYIPPPSHYVPNTHGSTIKSWGRSWETRKLLVCILHLILPQLLRIEWGSYSYSTFISL